MQATAQNPYVAKLLGVPVERMILYTFLINAGLVALARALAGDGQAAVVDLDRELVARHARPRVDASAARRIDELGAGFRLPLVGGTTSERTERSHFVRGRRTTADAVCT